MMEYRKDESIPTVAFQADTDWVAVCGVDGANFVIACDGTGENPAPYGSFCPDCRSRGMIAPGVLHWARRASAQQVSA